MIADEPRPTPGIGAPDATLLDADAFHHEMVSFIERELLVWRDQPKCSQVTDEPTLNQTLCLHLNRSVRHQNFDTIQFLQEPLQSAGRRADIGVMQFGPIVVEGRSYEGFEQLLPIECKRLPTPIDKRRSDCEYVHGLPGHRTGAIERFKHCLHGSQNSRALIIAYVQAESFAYWLTTINGRLDKLANDGSDSDAWSPAEILSTVATAFSAHMQRLVSRHRRSKPPGHSETVDIEHFWLRMN